VGLAAGLLLVVLAACGFNDDEDPTAAATATVPSGQVVATETPASADPSATPAPDEPTATPAPEQPTSTRAANEPTATPDDDEPTAEPLARRLEGSASVDDDTDDISDLLGMEPDDPMPGIDLTRVQLAGDGENLTVTIETAGDIQAELVDDLQVSFDVHLWQDDMPVYAMSFHWDGEAWEATITDFSGIMMDEQTVDVQINLNGNVLSATFPGAEMPDLEESFEWYSSVMLGESDMPGLDSWFDGAPDNIFALLADPEEFVEFPQ
jgi:hypothetical protein